MNISFLSALTFLFFLRRYLDTVTKLKYAMWARIRQERRYVKVTKDFLALHNHQKRLNFFKDLEIGLFPNIVYTFFTFSVIFQYSNGSY